MSFVSPDRFIWLLIAVPIVLLYILRTRMKKQPVATLLFWDQLFDEKRQRSWWQRLRHWLSLALQLAFLGLLVGALVDPLWRGQNDEARQVVIVLDTSASMLAKTENGKTRFDDAIEKAQGVVAGLRDGDEVALVTAGSSVRVVVGVTDFGPAVRDALREVQPTHGPTKVTEAIEAARRLTRQPDRREVVVISDLCFDQGSEEGSEEKRASENEQLDSQPDIRLMSVGTPENNVAVTAMSVRRSLVDPIGYAAMVQVHNFGDEAIECRLTIDLADELVDVIPLKIAAGESWKDTINEASANGGVLKATLDIDDGLEIDNVAMAVLPRRPKIPVTLVSQEPSVYLESVLSAIPLVELTTVTETPATAPKGGFLVLNRMETPKLPAGSVLAIDPRGDTDLWTVGEPIEQAIIAKQESASPLMPHVQLMNVVLPGARALNFPGDATSLLSDASGDTLMASLINEEDRIVVLAADLDNSDLPLRIAFPVMMTNAVNWFLRQTGELQPAIHTGELAEVLATDATEESWAWQDPAGKRLVTTLRDERALVGPIDQVGLAVLAPKRVLEKLDAQKETTDKADDSQTVQPDKQIEGVQQLAVNLCDPSESDLRPRSERAADDKLASGSGMRSIWFYMAFIGLGLVVGEWFLYHRRIVG